MKYKNHRAEPYFTFLKNGQKTIEGRIRNGKYAKIVSGDYIDVYNNDETDFVKVRLKRVTNYLSFKEMLTSELIKKVLPDVETVDKGLQIYRKFYSEEEEQKYGVVAIEVESTMSKERFQLRVAVYLMLIKDKKILLSRRFNTGWMDGKYSLIAGHLDGGESVSKAMIREAFEEAKIIINKDDLIPATVTHRVSDVEYIDFFFVAEKWQGEPVIGEVDKCDDLSWFPLNKLPDNLLPHVKEAIEKYQNKIAFFESGWESC